MAKEKDKEKPQEDQQKTSKKGSILQWIILGLIVLVCTASGTVLGRLFANNAMPSKAQSQENTEQKPLADLKSKEIQGNEEDVWYFILDPVVANLNEPKVTRYIRVTLTLTIKKTMDEKKGIAFFDTKKPYITNWLTIYLASQSVEDIRGDKNLKRIQSELANMLNERLFPESEQYITRVLIQEFAVQ
ncbi:MAG: flagellar basal body-associated FliL family protein [Sedimentisphaerales bacterium]|nr:flagellar basal body-associated FliL family protein [Sedimentisphaerales bacterium]